MKMITNGYLNKLIGELIHNNFNHLSELFEIDNMDYSYHISFHKNIECCIRFINEYKKFYQYSYTFSIYIECETYYNFSSYVFCDMYCNKAINFDDYRNRIREYYKYNIFLEVLKILSLLYKYGNEEFYNNSMNVYFESINLKNKLNEIKVELDKIFINKIINLCHIRYDPY